MTFGLVRSRTGRPVKPRPGPKRNGERSYHAFAVACRKAGKRNLLDELMDPVRVEVASGDADPSLVAALAAYRRRPFWTPTELAKIWPVVCVGLVDLAKPFEPRPADLRAGLLRHGTALLRKAGGSTWFARNGLMQEYFIVEDIARWSNRTVEQEQFDEVMKTRT